MRTARTFNRTARDNLVIEDSKNVEQELTASGSVVCGCADTGRAFEVFYAATAPALCAYIRRVSGNAAAAEDIVQEAFYRLLRGRHQGMDEARMRSYLYRTATTIIYDQWRRSRLAQPPTVFQIAATDPSARIDIERAFAGLTPRERALVWLAYVEGSTHAEIASSLGLTGLSVRVLLFRARGKLARILRSAGEGKR